MNSFIKKILYGDITIRININKCFEGEYLRFINLCKNKNVYIWKLILKENEAIFHTYKSNIDILEQICDKCGIKFEIVEQKGIPEFINRVMRYSSIFVGGVICVCTHFLLSLIVWDIEVSGNYIITESRMREYLKENNIVVGSKIKKINVKELENIIMRDFPEVIFVSASCDGTILKITLKEGLNYDYTKENEQCMNLVSDMDGYVESIITCKGVGVVKKGDEVKKGDVLISGIVKILDDSETVVSNMGVKAEGEVIIKGKVVYEDDFEKNYVKKNYIDKKSRIYPFFLEWKPLNNRDSCDIMEQKLCFSLFDTFKLPQILYSKEIYYYEEYEYVMSDKEIDEKIKEKIYAYIYKLSNEGIIADSFDYSMDLKNDTVCFVAEINVSKKAETLVSVSEKELIIEQSGGVQIGN